MDIVFAFAPFIVFALVERSLGVVPGLAAATAASIALLLRERLRGERGVGLVDGGSALLFAGLTCVAFVGDSHDWSLWQVRLCVDGGLLLLVCASIVLRKPFTLHHARRHVSASVADSAAFLHTNVVISTAWAVAIGVMAAVDLLMVSRPDTAVALGTGASLCALAGALAFTRWFAERVRVRAAAARAAASEELA